MMVVHWCLTFLRQGQICFPVHLYGLHTSVLEKCWELQMTSPLKLRVQCCSNFMWRLLGAGEWKIAKMVAVHLPRRPPCPYMVETFKNLLLQNQKSPGVILCTNHRGQEVYQNCWIMVLHWPLTFLRQGHICFPMHLYGPYAFIWEKCWEFIFWTSPL